MRQNLLDNDNKQLEDCLRSCKEKRSIGSAQALNETLKGPVRPIPSGADLIMRKLCEIHISCVIRPTGEHLMPVAGKHLIGVELHGRDASTSMPDKNNKTISAPQTFLSPKLEAESQIGQIGMESEGRKTKKVP